MELKKGISRFNYVGKCLVGDKTFSINQNGSTNKNYVYSKLNLAVNCANREDESNINYCELMGGYEPGKTKIFTHGYKDGDKYSPDYDNKIEIPFEQRHTGIIEQVAEDCFIVLGGFETDEKGASITRKFLSEYDAIKYLQEHLIDGDVLSIKGSLRASAYNGKTQLKKVISSVWKSNAKVENFKASFELQAFTSDESFGSIDDEGYLPVYSNIVDYSREDERNVCFPFVFYIDTNKNKKYELIINNYLKPKNSETVFRVGVQGVWAKSDNTTEIKVDDLAQDLKDLIAVGLLSEEEALGRAVGFRKSNAKPILTSFITSKNEGGVDTLLIDKENYKKEDLIVVPTEPDTQTEVKATKENTEKSKDTTSDLSAALSDLFD